MLLISWCDVSTAGDRLLAALPTIVLELVVTKALTSNTGLSCCVGVQGDAFSCECATTCCRAALLHNGMGEVPDSWW